MTAFDGVLVGAMLWAFFNMMGWAKAEELSLISPAPASYCALYSRTETLMDILHPKEGLVADTDVVLQRAKGHYTDCLSVVPTLLPVSQGLQPWLADMRDLIILKARYEGTMPATEKPTVREDTSWKDQCRAEYRSWDEDTGTVVRRGSPERVKCPCGTEVECGG